MKISNKVKVSNDLKDTYNKFGEDPLMEEMKGGIFDIVKFSSGGIILEYKKNQFFFSKNDVKKISLKQINIKAEFFDPVQLIS